MIIPGAIQSNSYINPSKMGKLFLKLARKHGWNPPGAKKGRGRTIHTAKRGGPFRGKR